MSCFFLSGGFNSDIFNNLMVIPNVIALFALTKMVVSSAESKIAQ